MKTFFEIPQQIEGLPGDVRELAFNLGHLFFAPLQRNALFTKLFERLKIVFPVDYILFTYASIRPGCDEFYLFPKARSVSKAPTPSREQVETILNSNSKTIVRWYDSDDHLISSDFLRSCLPCKDFSVLLIRTCLDDEHIYSFSIISCGKSTYSDVYLKYFFSICDVVLRYFEMLSQTQPNVNYELKEFSQKEICPISVLPGMHKIQQMIWNISWKDCPVLLLGETGTGKEIVVNAIHHCSARRNGPLVKMNCGSIPETLVDSELFGHERGAFTGAIERVVGRFERAHQGMLLLDEIGELPLTVQTRLLRVLQEGVIERVGGGTEIPIDVRIVAATHRDLDQMVQDNKFRQDLLYRLNLFPIHIPPLRERKEDILILSRFILQQKCSQYGVSTAPEISDRDMGIMSMYNWPGNIRELHNVIERSVILWIMNTKKTFNIDAAFMEKRTGSQSSAADNRDDAICPLDEMIIRHIRKALALSNWKVTGHGGAAERLCINPNTLKSKIRKYNISK